MQQIVHLFVLVFPALAVTNNVDFIWFDGDGQAQNYFARQPYPEMLNETKKIVMNQKLPILWDVRLEFFNNLEELVIDDCAVGLLQPGSFKSLSPLANLSLAFNNIKSVQEGVFNFIEVKFLNLQNNQLQSIAAKAFDNMPILEKLNLNFNELKQWNAEWFLNCPILSTVSISHNFLEELPPRAFRNLNNTLNLYFSYNKIDRIDRETFEEVGAFEDLFLDWNDIPRVDGHTFGKITSIQHLNLNGDSLRCLSEEFITSVLNKTMLLTVLENPFKCECLKELTKRESKLRSKVVYSKDTECD